nr:hypothetical protein [Kribbella antibiotica]
MKAELRAVLAKSPGGEITVHLLERF